MDLKRIPSKILNLDEVMQTLYSNIAKQKNNSHYHYQDRMRKLFLYTKKINFGIYKKSQKYFHLFKIITIGTSSTGNVF